MTTAACPACGPVTASARRVTDALPTHQLLLPHIHCAACIRTVEDTLNSLPGIASARVNLSQKRALITAQPLADATPWIDALARAGHPAHEVSENDTPKDNDGLVMRLGVAGFAMMNVMLLSVAVWSGATDATRDMFHWISAMIALPATGFAATPFFTRALSALKAARLNMDVPISLAILLACGMSLFEVMAGGHHVYFDAALSLTFFLLAGRVLEARMRRVARSAAGDLAALEPQRTTRIVDGKHQSTHVRDLAIGDTLWLAAGARVPVDATLAAPSAQIDRSALTGEVDPITLPRGSELFAGDILLTGPAQVTATAVGEDTTLRRMSALVAVAEGARGRYTSLADRAAKLYAPLVHGLAACAFAGWVWATGDIRFALNVAIATLIITCPCALGLAVPTVATAATGHFFRRGFLVKSDTALERLAEVDTILFDKTGTLSESRLVPPGDLPDSARAILASLARSSDHALCRGLRTDLADTTPAKLSDISETKGLGLTAMAGDTPVALGLVPDADHQTALTIGTKTWPLAREERLLPGAKDAVTQFVTQGLDLHLVSGDTPERARTIAATLGIATAHAGITPEGKEALVADLQSQGRKVLMIGDGLNDTAALTSAWASLAPGTALQASRNAADIVMLTSDLARLGHVVTDARIARRRILQNFGIAASYNAVAIPLAVAGFATPLMAALAMSLSSLTVTLNALRIRRSE